jgi:hypothetical protein
MNAARIKFESSLGEFTADVLTNDHWTDHTLVRTPVAELSDEHLANILRKWIPKVAGLMNESIRRRQFKDNHINLTASIPSLEEE